MVQVIMNVTKVLKDMNLSNELDKSTQDRRVAYTQITNI